MIILAWVLLIGRVVGTIEVIGDDTLKSDTRIGKVIANILIGAYITWSIIQIRGGLF